MPSKRPRNGFPAFIRTRIRNKKAHKKKSMYRKSVPCPTGEIFRASCLWTLARVQTSALRLDQLRLLLKRLALLGRWNTGSGTVSTTPCHASGATCDITPVSCPLVCIMNLKKSSHPSPPSAHYNRVIQSADKLKRKAGNQPTARYVTWGFKAPVAMLLVPFFQEAWGQVKFLHVVRDGRDIAFSGNQSPVKKFFDDTFPVSSRERGLGSAALMAIRLWSVWNSGLYMWAAAKRKGGRVSGPEGQADYLLLHVEDLIDPGAKVISLECHGRTFCRYNPLPTPAIAGRTSWT